MALDKLTIANQLDYLGTHKDFGDFTHQISENTGNHYKDLWLENARANRDLIRQHGWACEDLMDAHKGKTSILLGASPAIRKQIEDIKELQQDPDFVLIGISSGLQYLFDNDIKPKYVFIADADPMVKRFWETLDYSKTRDITLISNISTTPELIRKWQGPLKFLGIWTTIKKLDHKFRKWFPNMNGNNEFFFGLMSQYNTAAAMAFTVFGTKILIFVGNEFGFKDREATYYADRSDLKDKFIRKPHIDIYGNVYYTNYGLLSLKLILEDFLGKLAGDGWFFNCTEAGIFGVTVKHGNLPWIQQFKLKTGIGQARHIMVYGKPLYELSTIQKPTFKETLLYARA